MSDHLNWWRDVYRKAMNIPCPYCGVGVGHWCVTSNDKRATYLHGARTRKVQREKK